MKDLLFILASSFAYSYASGKAPKITAYTSSPTLFKKPMQPIYTKHGDIMHLGECKENDVTYGIISFKLDARFDNLSEAQDVLVQFMQKLQPTFAVQHTVGITKEPITDAAKAAVTDYWQDVEKTDWKVKGWTDGSTVAVLYIKNISNAPSSKEEYFLNGTPFGEA